MAFLFLSSYLLGNLKCINRRFGYVVLLKVNVTSSHTFVLIQLAKITPGNTELKQF